MTGALSLQMTGALLTDDKDMQRVEKYWILGRACKVIMGL